MPGPYPSKVRPWWRYLPLGSLAAMVWWMVGMGLWVHYTKTVYNRAMDSIDELRLVIAGSLVGQIQVVMDALVSTCVLYAVAAVGCHGLCIWQGYIEAQQDREGRVHETHGIILLYANVGVQVYLWIVLVWMGALLKGMGVFEGAVATAQDSLQNVVEAYETQVAYQRAQGMDVTSLTPNPDGLSCPVGCLALNTFGLTFEATDVFQPASNVCICDKARLDAGLKSINAAGDAIPAMVAGMLLLYVYGLWQAAVLVAQFARTRRDQNLSDRLAEVEAGTGKAAVGMPAGPRPTAAQIKASLGKGGVARGPSGASYQSVPGKAPAGPSSRGPSGATPTPFGARRPAGGAARGAAAGGSEDGSGSDASDASEPPARQQPPARGRPAASAPAGRSGAVAGGRGGARAPPAEQSDDDDLSGSGSDASPPPPPRGAARGRR